MSTLSARTTPALLVVCTLLGLLAACQRKDETPAPVANSSERSGSRPAAPPSTDRPSTERVEKKSGERSGKAAPRGVIKTASGLQYEVLKQGEGPSPAPTDKVTVHYHGTLQDGTVFDSSVDRNEPATFPVTGVIQGWIEGLQLMKVGSKYRFVIPPNLAYGDQGAGDVIGPNQTLVFEVELLSID